MYLCDFLNCTFDKLFFFSPLMLVIQMLRNIAGISKICMKQLTESQKNNNYVFSEECRVELTRAEKMIGETMDGQPEL